ncbi:MAG: hypothetical protein ACREQ5_03615 [Candidatus Dormibacteria bacterium]
MGKTVLELGGGGNGEGTPPPTGASLSDILNAINALGVILDEQLAEFMTQFDPGQVNAFVDFNPNGTIGTTASRLYPSNKRVRRAIIQNLSTTDNVTVTASGSPNTIATSPVAGKGIILNKATASGLGGGSMTLDNVDLSGVTVVTDTNTGQNIAVYYEI